jgi:hypothetical protein
MPGYTMPRSPPSASAAVMPDECLPAAALLHYGSHFPTLLAVEL